MRRTPLVRTVPLRRTLFSRPVPVGVGSSPSSPLVGKPAQAGRRRLPAVSPRHAATLRIYGKRRAVFLAAHPGCARCGGPATDVHHMRGRVGPDLLDERWWRALCRPCHARVTEHPAEALADGWSLPRVARDGAA